MGEVLTTLPALLLLAGLDRRRLQGLNCQIDSERLPYWGLQMDVLLKCRLKLELRRW